MLPFFRKNIKLIIWLIVLSFVIWGAGTAVVSRNQEGSSKAGKVFGKTVSITELQSLTKFYDTLVRSGVIAYKRAEPTNGAETVAEENASTENTAVLPSYEEINNLAWQTIILSRKAKKMNLEVTDEEVANEIQQLFSPGRPFNTQFYHMWVQNEFRGTPREFEEAIRKHLSVRKVREAVLADTGLGEQEKTWISWLSSLFQEAQFVDYSKPAA